MRRVWMMSLLLVLLILQSGSAVHINSPTFSVQCRKHWGPFIDKLVYIPIKQEDQQVLALRSNDIDLIGGFIDSIYLPILEASENIEVAQFPSNGYGYLSINCVKYPLNITAFRRAFAYALNKEEIKNDVWDELSQLLDSCVPMINPFSIEESRNVSYYEGDVSGGNQILDKAGFVDRNGDGWRDAPNGSQFEVCIECAVPSNQADETCRIANKTLTALKVKSKYYPYFDCYCVDLIFRLNKHSDYDIAFLEKEFRDFNVEWLGYEFWSGYVNEFGWNLANFANATFDSWRRQLLHSIEYEEVFEASSKMQEIILYECPIIVCYEKLGFSAYRTDVYENHYNLNTYGIFNWWTLAQVRRKADVGGPFGGTFRVAISEDVDTFNPLLSSQWRSGQIMDMMYESIARINQDGEYVPFLVDDWVIETHQDNPFIQDGHTRITFTVIDNADWTDGHERSEAFTAYDIAYAINFSRYLENPIFNEGLDNLVACYTPRNNIVVVEFDTESYWNLHKICHKPILPMKELENIDPLECEPYPPIDEMMILGPFVVTEYVVGEFTELTYNLYYYYLDSSTIFWDDFNPRLDGSFGSPFSYVEGTTGHELSWLVYGEEFDQWRSWELYQGDTLVAWGTFPLQDQLYFNVDGLPEGVHEFQLRIYSENALLFTRRAEIIVLPTDMTVFVRTAGISFTLTTFVMMSIIIIKRKSWLSP